MKRLFSLKVVTLARLIATKFWRCGSLRDRTKRNQPQARSRHSFFLRASPAGTDEPEKLIISAAARSIQLQLDVEREEDYQSFVAEIRTARGNLAWSASGLAVKRTSYGRAVFLTIPARLISNREYDVALKGAASGKV